MKVTAYISEPCGFSTVHGNLRPGKSGGWVIDDATLFRGPNLKTTGVSIVFPMESRHVDVYLQGDDGVCGLHRGEKPIIVTKNMQLLGIS